MIKFFILFSFCCSSLYNLHSQIERTKTWVFGDGAGLIFNKNGFDTFSVSPTLNHYEGNGIWNDKNGDLFLYSDNYRLFDKRDTQLNEGYDFGGASSSCQAVILTSLNDTIIHCFGTIPEDDWHGGYVYNRYNVVKDSWEVAHIKLQPRISECQAHVNHQNGKWQWVVAHSLTGNTLYSYLIKKEGLEECSTISLTGPNYNKTTGQGVMKFSPDGKYLFTAAFNLNVVTVNKFNSQTGKANELFRLNVGSRPYGMEIYENHLFISLDDLQDRIISYSLKTMNKDSVIQSKKIVYDTTSSDVIGQMQTSPDGNLYVSLYGANRLGIIKKSNSNYVYGHTKELFDTKTCGDGFPNFNASFFHSPSLDFTYSHTCQSYIFNFKAKDTFNANNFTWNFRKGSTTETKTGKDLNYTFLDTGQWKVQLIASNGGRIDTIEKTIEVFNTIPQGFLGMDTTYTFNAFINGTLNAPANQHCSHWWQLGDTIETMGSSYSYTNAGTYICKTTNKHFCHSWDTIQVKVCDTGFGKITRVKDTLFPNQVLDSNIWYKDDVRLGEAKRIDLSSQGNYTLVQTNEFGCKDTSEYEVSFLYANTKDINTSKLSIYPNPNKGEFIIEGIKSNSLIRIMDSRGREVCFIQKENTIKLIHSSRGVYFLQIGEELIKLLVE